MRNAYILALCAVLMPSMVVAQAPSPAQMGITTATPNTVQVLDSSRNWSTIGTVDPATHLFSPAGVAGVLPPLVTSFNTRIGAVTLISGDVTGALGFTPYNATNPVGYITASALTPYALLNSPAFTGTPSLPTGTTGVTQTAGDSSTKLATTAFVRSAVTAGAYTLPTASTTVLGGVKVDGSTINIDGSGVISGTPSGVTANSTPTSGFPFANQLVYSDGSLVQGLQAGKVMNVGDTAQPIYFGSLNATYGHSPHIGISVFGDTGAGVELFASPAGVEMPGGPGTFFPQAFIGFTTGTNSAGISPDIAFTTTGGWPISAASFRHMASNDPSVLRVYNTYTDDSNGEWGALDWYTTPNVLTIGTQYSGTGLARPMNLVASNLQINGTVAVSCAAGTVSLTTLVVTNGIITHC